MKELQYIRVLQHELHGDNIRIGAAYPILNCTDESLDKAVKKAVETYEKSRAGKDSFEESCKKYYERVALVDADTLEVLRLIYPKS